MGMRHKFMDINGGTSIRTSLSELTGFDIPQLANGFHFPVIKFVFIVILKFL
jgi:hypothetical protein